jgi:putative modified peptide
MATNETSRGRVRMDVTTESAQRFLQLLSEDDEFRSRLARDPKAVLSEYGVQVSPDLIPARIKLPSKLKIWWLRLLFKRPDPLMWWPFLFGHTPKRH